MKSFNFYPSRVFSFRDFPRHVAWVGYFSRIIQEFFQACLQSSQGYFFYRLSTHRVHILCENLLTTSSVSETYSSAGSSDLQFLLLASMNSPLTVSLSSTPTRPIFFIQSMFSANHKALSFEAPANHWIWSLIHSIPFQVSSVNLSTLLQYHWVNHKFPWYTYSSCHISLQKYIPPNLSVLSNFCRSNPPIRFKFYQLNQTILSKFYQPNSSTFPFCSKSFSVLNRCSNAVRTDFPSFNHCRHP